MCCSQTHRNNVEQSGCSTESPNRQEFTKNNFLPRSSTDKKRLHGASFFFPRTKINSRIKRTYKSPHDQHQRKDSLDCARDFFLNGIAWKPPTCFTRIRFNHLNHLMKSRRQTKGKETRRPQLSPPFGNQSTQLPFHQFG